MALFRGPLLSEATAASLVLGIVVIIPFMLSFNPYYVSIFISALILGAVSISWNLLAGVCGQVSFGHAAFFGIGAYASAILATRAGWDPYIAMRRRGSVRGSWISGYRNPRVSSPGPVFCARDLRVCGSDEAGDLEHDLAH